MASRRTFSCSFRLTRGHVSTSSSTCLSLKRHPRTLPPRTLPPQPFQKGRSLANCRPFHEGLSSNWNRRPPKESRGRLIGRLDRILKSDDAHRALSVEQLAHIQYLRDYWAHQDEVHARSVRDLRDMDIMTHETAEVLGRYSAQVEQGSVTAISDDIPPAQNAKHKKQLRGLERFSRRLTQHWTSSPSEIGGKFVVEVIWTIILLYLFQLAYKRLFPERWHQLMEEDRRQHAELYASRKGTRTSTKQDTEPSDWEEREP